MAFKFGGATSGGTPTTNKTATSSGFGFAKKDEGKPAPASFGGGGFSMGIAGDQSLIIFNFVHIYSKKR